MSSRQILATVSMTQEDGSVVEKGVRMTVHTQNGISPNITGGTTIKIIDNSKLFDDMKEVNWARNSRAFVDSRELFRDTSASTFERRQK